MDSIKKMVKASSFNVMFKVCIVSNCQYGASLAVGIEVFLSRGLWENYSTANLNDHLSKHFLNEFMVFTSYSRDPDALLWILVPVRVKQTIKQGLY